MRSRFVGVPLSLGLRLRERRRFLLARSRPSLVRGPERFAQDRSRASGVVGGACLPLQPWNLHRGFPEERATTTCLEPQGSPYRFLLAQSPTMPAEMRLKNAPAISSS